jgi:hypothetical protein
MGDLMSYLTGFGLAAGAGTKAFIPVLALGAFHYTEYFELSERWAWIASPPVMALLAVMVIAEILVDASPELGEYSDTVAYMPKLAAGFIAFAAATGTVDESLTQLGTSGLLGAATATGVHWLRNKIRRPIRAYFEDLHEGVGKLSSFSEAGVATAVAGTGVMIPPLAVILIGVAGVTGFAIAIMLDRHRVSCVHPDCGRPIRPGALVCKHCGREQAATASVADEVPAPST